MKIVKAGYKIIDKINGIEMLKKIESIARTCYKSESVISDDESSAVKMVKDLIKKGHEAMLEHCAVTVKFICDRGVSHEIVRHRLASYAQESTRYCNYSQDKFGNEITVIEPLFFKPESPEHRFWYNSCLNAENRYFDLIRNGITPEKARTVLPNSLKTEIVVTMNLREWRHFFNLRAVGATGKPHPQMQELAIPLLKDFADLIPIVFDDLVEGLSNE